MTVYVLALLHIHDRDRYAQYEGGFMEIFAKYKGELLAVEEEPTVTEGDWKLASGESITRTVLLRFPDAESLGDWYDSPEYQELAQHRFAAATASIVTVRGLSSS